MGLSLLVYNIGQRQLRAILFSALAHITLLFLIFSSQSLDQTKQQLYRIGASKRDTLAANLNQKGFF